MSWLFGLLALGSVGAATLVIWRGGALARSRGRDLYDPARLGRAMVDDAETPEEKAYLEEMAELELHRRHLVC